MPQILTKSMEYHYPAEFIVPTNIPYDLGPIGQAYETEFEHQEVEVGLRLEDIMQGLLVAGGTSAQRFHTNFKIVYEAAMAEENYLIITTNREWRRLLDLIPQACVLRLGTDLTINPIDPEGGDTIEHVTTLAHAFAQAFYLSRLGQEHIMDSLVSLFEGIRVDAPSPDLEEFKAVLESRVISTRGAVSLELGVVHQALMNMGFGRLSLVFGKTNIPMEQLMTGITIIEVEAVPQQDLQFIILCLLAKLLSYSATHQNRHLLLVDVMDALMLHDPRSSKTRDTEHYLLDWVQRFKSHRMGLHLSLGIPSRVPPVILDAFQTVLAFKITSHDDVQIISNLLQFMPDRLVHSRERHDNYQVEFLKTQPANLFVLKRVDITNAFPVHQTCTNLAKTHVWEDAELQDRLHLFFPDWQTPKLIPRVGLERNFSGKAILIAQRVLSLLKEYPDLGTSGIFASLRSNPELDLEMAELEGVLTRLVHLNYIVNIERDDGRGHIHKSYQPREKGLEALHEYTEELNRRTQPA